MNARATRHRLPFRSRRFATLALAFWLALPLTSCRDDMYDQPRFESMEATPLFSDGASARPALRDTVARGDRIQTTVFDTGRTPDGRLAIRLPGEVELTPGLLRRGRAQYEIHCAPCHGLTGAGNGMIVQRGFPAPPSYHEPRLHDAPIGHFFDVITNGYGVMYDYADRVAPANRWAVAAYIRALQLSQNAPLDDAPPEIRRRLEEE